jgi:hypothetical protein
LDGSAQAYYVERRQWRIVEQPIGTPAPTPKRPVIEDSYDFALTVILADLAAQEAYQVDPVHKAFVAKFSMWRKIMVTDALE